MKKLLPALVMALLVLTFSNATKAFGFDNSIFLAYRAERTADMELSIMCVADGKYYGDNVAYNLSPLQDITIIRPLEKCFSSGLSSEFSANLTIQGSSNLVSIKIITKKSRMGESQSCEVVTEGATMSPSITRESAPNDCRIYLLYQ